MKGKQTPAIPEIAGFYISEKTKDWQKENKLKLQTLFIQRNGKGELDFTFQTLTRLQFAVSDNREELKLRLGKIYTSDRELLFVEAFYKEFHRLFHGKTTEKITDWSLRDFSPFVKVREVGSLFETNSGRSAEISQDLNTIKFSDGEVYVRIGQPLLGRITVQVSKFKKTIDNQSAGILFYPLSPGVYSANLEKNFWVGFFSKTDDLTVDMLAVTPNNQWKIAEIFENLVILEQLPNPQNRQKPQAESSPPVPLSPILLAGSIDLKAVTHKSGTEELIERLKNDPNLSKEQLIRELEKLKGK
ncbi:LIC12353 family lipoprotein [Leptospira perolatii]|uniref:LIC12353 family lipoprotein n=1 Tax=Leptospira perolatii TaxID=2023191 RepID=UPI001FAEFD39|nr:hypothetical protein [Leptospira perolatii]